VTLWTLLVINNWQEIMGAYAHVYGELYRVYFMLYYLIVIIVLTVVLAFIFDAFLFRVQLSEAQRKAAATADHANDDTRPTRSNESSASL
jgi:two pore calcium channel protein 1